MTTIQVLPPTVIHKIAAGEVAERPATIIKELIENALDASATQIKIEVDLGRQTKIIVSDNGTGMSPEDLVVAPLRHSTSKIFRFEDLQTLDSFGFRGEALAAIAYASRMTVMSRLATEVNGYAITVEEDVISSPRPVGMASGTTVIVENLFEHLPARHAFLKKPATELKRITDVIAAAAVGQPQVGFIFEYQHKRIWALPPGQDIVRRSLELYRLSQADDLLEINFGTAPLLLSGWIGKPHVASYAKHQQLWLINQRPVHQSELSQVVKNSYGSLLEPRAEPSFVLQLQVPQTSIDINAHPQKDSVNFSHTTEIHQLIASAVSQRLSDADLSFSLPQNFRTSSGAANPKQPLNRNSVRVTKNAPDFQQLATQSWQPGATQVSDSIMQLGRTYLVLETKQGLHLIDQHAAHERILFESFLSQLQQQPSTLEPGLVLHPTVVEKKTFEAYRAELSKMGFEAEDFGQDILKLSQIPAVLTHQSKSEIAELFMQMLDEMVTMNRSLAWEEMQRQIIASLACHSAVRAGDFLTPTQREELITKLDQTPNSATCPHGRPTTIKVTFKELAVLFKRLK